MQHVSMEASLQSWAETTGGQGDDPPNFGVGDKVSCIPNVFTVQKIFNASSMLCCFCKKFQQGLKLGRPHGGLFERAILAKISSV
jgi:hypothetical protein